MRRSLAIWFSLSMLTACGAAPDEHDDVGAVTSALSATGSAATKVKTKIKPKGKVKVPVCHRKHSAYDLIQVGTKALASHLAHGDHEPDANGSCDVDPCASLPDGTMFCAEDVANFVTCDHGQSVVRTCATGTHCKPFAGAIVCDW